MRAAAAVLLLVPVLTGCQVGPAPPGPAEFRAGPPPWDAPRDAVSYIDAAGFERLPLDFRGPAPYTLRIEVEVAGRPVAVASGIGVDRVRAEQAAVHTHTEDGLVYVEAKTTGERPTLAQFFQLWGVRYTESCLGDACRGLTVTMDNSQTTWNTALFPNSTIKVSARH